MPGAWATLRRRKDLRRKPCIKGVFQRSCAVKDACLRIDTTLHPPPALLLMGTCVNCLEPLSLVLAVLGCSYGHLHFADEEMEAQRF